MHGPIRTQHDFHPETIRHARADLDLAHRLTHDQAMSIHAALVAAFEHALVHPWIISLSCLTSATCALSAMAISLRAGDAASS